MSQQKKVKRVQVAEPLGWAVSEDKKSVLIGFKDGRGKEIDLALEVESLRKFLLCAIDGTRAFPREKIGAKTDAMMIGANWFEFGTTADPGYYLAFYRDNGAHLTFKFDHELATKIADAMGKHFAQADTKSQPPAPPTGTSGGTKH